MPMNQALTEHLTVADLPRHHTFLNGQLVAGGGAPTSDAHPGDGSVLATVEETAPDLVREAVARAAAAQPAWADTSPHERARVLRTAADLVEADAERLVRLVALDNGKTLAEARGDVFVAAAHLRGAAAW